MSGRNFTCRCEPRSSGTNHFSIPHCEGEWPQDCSGFEQGIQTYERFSQRTVTTRQIDLPAARPDQAEAQMEATFGIDPADILRMSAKTGKNISSILEAIVERIPPAEGEINGSLAAFLFDSS